MTSEQCQKGFLTVRFDHSKTKIRNDQRQHNFDDVPFLWKKSWNDKVCFQLFSDFLSWRVLQRSYGKLEQVFLFHPCFKQWNLGTFSVLEQSPNFDFKISQFRFESPNLFANFLRISRQAKKASGNFGTALLASAVGHEQTYSTTVLHASIGGTNQELASPPILPASRAGAGALRLAINKKKRVSVLTFQRLPHMGGARRTKFKGPTKQENAICSLGSGGS